MKNYELKATTQKSYYGKAQVFESDAIIALKSYDTFVCYMDKTTGEFVRCWGDWSRTTANHVNDFLKLIGKEKVNKKEWEKMNPVGFNYDLLWKY